MRLALFCHSLLSDWNHGNAHFLRGVTAELRARGHEVRVFEPRDAWSVQNLVADHGPEALAQVHEAYPGLAPHRYDLATLDLERALDGVDAVLVHEWNDPALVRRLGDLRRGGARYRLLFHDTHHRMVTAPAAMRAYDLTAYDGVLAFGAVLRDLYLSRGLAARAWVWHEAADTRVFQVFPEVSPADGDLVWVGNWGDDERTAELREYLLDPVKSLGLRATVYGVRYPDEGRQALEGARIAYRGWLPNHRVPRVFARHRVTIHVPRRPYAEALRGIPTIRPFEALACGIPLVSAPWDDTEGLFQAGRDYLVAKNGAAMEAHLRALRHDPALRRELVTHGLATIRARHTCAHRVDELLRVLADLGVATTPASAARPMEATV
jgi:spore maturation protein CgeB